MAACPWGSRSGPGTAEWVRNIGEPRTDEARRAPVLDYIGHGGGRAGAVINESLEVEGVKLDGLRGHRETGIIVDSRDVERCGKTRDVRVPSIREEKENRRRRGIRQTKYDNEIPTSSHLTALAAVSRCHGRADGLSDFCGARPASHGTGNGMVFWVFFRCASPQHHHVK